MLIRAMARLKTRPHRVECRIAGSGYMLRMLKDLARGLYCSDVVRFVGGLNAREVAYFLSGIDILVLPSYSEGMPIVPLEAMAARVPYVATSVGGVPDMTIDGQTGLLVPPGDPEALADAIERLILSPELRQRLADNAYAHWKQHYTEEACWPVVEQLYRKMLESGHRRNPGEPARGGHARMGVNSEA